VAAAALVKQADGYLVEKQSDNLKEGLMNKVKPRITGFLDFAHHLGILNNKTPWPESANELHRPSNRRLSAKLVQLLRVEGATW
jgi:hypothetical protein